MLRVLLFFVILSIVSESTSAQINATETQTQHNDTLPWFIQKIVFLPISRSYVFWSKEELSEPGGYGLTNVRNFYIPVGERRLRAGELEGERLGTGEDGGERLGAWYMWPLGGGASDIESIPRNSTLVIYMHGNSRDRGHRHRVRLYKVLQRLGLHVLAFDYRGFGDSSPTHLSEFSTVEDAKTVLDWVDSMYGEDRPHVVVWGHSLGTAIATIAVARRTDATNNTLVEDGGDMVEHVNMVDGLVLESPFNTMEDEVRSFKTARLAAYMMGLDIAGELVRAGVEFRTQDHLPQVSAPTLLLHADGDYIVPLDLGVKLFNNTVDAGKTNINMVSFSKSHRLRHRHIHRAPGIELYIGDLLAKAKNFRRNAIVSQDSSKRYITV